MAWSLFAIITGIFAIRGLFLGFIGVIAKALGLLLAYVVTFSYREDVANVVTHQTTLTDLLPIPPLLLPVITSVGLFFGTFLLTGAMINLSAQLLGSLIPALQFLLRKDNISARLLGAGLNGLIGAAIVLLAIWGYDKFGGKGPVNDPLHRLAGRFGDQVVGYISTGLSSHQPAAIAPATTTAAQPGSGSRTIIGTAEIISSSDPSKRLRIESISEQQVQEWLNQATGQPTANRQLQAVLDSPQWQQLVNHPQLQQLALDEVRNDPQRIKALLENPELRELLRALPLTDNPE